MAPSENASILRRKIGAQNKQTEISGMTARKALRLAAARAAQDMVALELTATGCIEERLLVEDVVAACGGGSDLMLLLEGPERALGLACIEMQVVAGIVEHQTTGRVVPSQADPRQVTRTDAMMVSDLLDGILAVFDSELAQMPDAPPTSGFHQLVVIEDARAVMMALEDIPYRQFQLALDLGGGAKSGEIILYFPFHPPRKRNFRNREFNEWHDKWRGHVLDLPAPIEAIIHRVSMPVNEVLDLAVGTMIPVPVSKISAVSLEGMDNHSVATGKLGQAGGFRAIRITSDVRTPGMAGNETATAPLNIVPVASLAAADFAAGVQAGVQPAMQPAMVPPVVPPVVPPTDQNTPQSVLEPVPIGIMDLPQPA